MIGWIAKVVGSVFTLKFFMSGVLMVIIGITAYNLMVEIVQEVMNFAIAKINGVSVGSVTNPTITGFAGWFLAQIKLPECFAVIVSAVSIKFILRKIPFLRW